MTWRGVKVLCWNNHETCYLDQIPQIVELQTCANSTSREKKLSKFSRYRVTNNFAVGTAEVACDLFWNIFLKTSGEIVLKKLFVAKFLYVILFMLRYNFLRYSSVCFKQLQ